VSKIILFKKEFNFYVTLKGVSRKKYRPPKRKVFRKRILEITKDHPLRKVPLKSPVKSPTQILNRKVLLKSKADIDKFTDLKIHFIGEKLAKKVGLYQVFY